MNVFLGQIQSRLDELREMNKADIDTWHPFGLSGMCAVFGNTIFLTADPYIITFDISSKYPATSMVICID